MGTSYCLCYLGLWVFKEDIYKAIYKVGKKQTPPHFCIAMQKWGGVCIMNNR